MTAGSLKTDEQDGYQSFLLRLWRAKSHGRWLWRASLESPHTGERQLFPCLEQLFSFLSDRCGRLTPEAREEAATERPVRGTD